MSVNKNSCRRSTGRASCTGEACGCARGVPRLRSTLKHKLRWLCRAMSIFTCWERISLQCGNLSRRSHPRQRESVMG